MKRFSAGLALACLLLLCLAQVAAASGSGIVMAWGRNDYGQLGDGTTTNSSLPLQTSEGQAVAVAGGARHTAALKVGGTVWAWGDNTYGQLGDGTTDGSLAPVQVTDTFGNGLAGITAIACGANHTAALRPDGTVLAWGANDAGQLGNGSSDQTAHPVPGQVMDATGASLTGVIAIACGKDFTVALSAGGTVLAWGKNDHGQLGNNTTIDSSVPVPVSGLSGVIAIAAGAAHAVALKSDGTVWAWGINDQGQLGNNSTTDSHTPVQVAVLGGAVAVACGAAHSLALMPDGTVWAWGDNTYGQLGNGAAMGSLIPVQVTGPAQTGHLTGVNAVAAGAYHSAALTSGGAVLTWGADGDGQLGDGSTMYRYAPVQVGGLTDVIAVACGPGHTLAIAPAPAPDIVMSWGFNKFGQLGDGTIVDSSLPVQSVGVSGIKSIADGFAHSIALKSDGAVWSWGSNSYGQLGDGNTGNTCSFPVQAGSPAGIKAIAGGQYHTLALGPDGTVWSWGYNCYGQLGTGNTNSSNLPVNTGSLAGVKAIACGGGYSVALKSDGTVWAWGNNNCGQLGNGTTNNRYSPGQVKGLGGSGFLAGVSAIACGYSHTVALKSDGTVWTWGFNTFGNLGDGTTIQRTTPVLVKGLDRVVAISSGYYYSIALKADGTVWAWGSNGNGQLGDGTMLQRNTPVQVKGLDGVIAIAGGTYHALALKSDGTAWAWGSNVNGQLGDGTKNNSSVPVQVVGLTGVTGVAAGSNYTSASVAVPDTTAPTSAINALSNGAILRGAAYNITGTADDGSGSGVQKVEVSINGGAWVKASGSASWSYMWTLPADGNYAIKCRATDNAGNVETAGTGITVMVDNAAPTSAITVYPGDAGVARSNWTISGRASDGTGSGVRMVEVSTDGGVTWHTAAGTAAWSYSCLSPTLGSYSIKSRATDNAGNIETPGAGVITYVNGFDLSFRQNGRTVTLGAAGLSRGKPLAGKTITFKASLFDIASRAWGAWSVLGSANSGADGTATGSYILANDGTYRFLAECNTGAEVLTSNPTSNCVMRPPGGLLPASGFVADSRRPAVNWAAFVDDEGKAAATGYELQTCADQNFTVNVTSTTLGNVTSATLPAQTRSYITWWRVVAVMPAGRSIPSAAASITFAVKTSISTPIANAFGRIIRPYVTLTDNGSGPISGRMVYFYYEEGTAADWKLAGQARTDSSGTARMAPLALAPGSYDLKAVFSSGPGFSPSGSGISTFTLQ